MDMCNVKRKISLLLILCMFVSMLPASVAADDSEILPGLDGSAADTDTAATDISPDGEVSAPPDNGADLVPIADVSRSTTSDVPGPVADTRAAVNGSCGDDATWTFNDATNTLTISGSGAIKDFDKVEDVAWYDHKDNINVVNIEGTITHIGKNAFREHKKISTLRVPSTTITADPDAFKDCSPLSIVEVSGRWKYAEGVLNVLSDEAVTAPVQWEPLRDRIEKVVISSAVKNIPADTFADMEKLKDSDRYHREPAVEYEGTLTDWEAITGDTERKRGLKADFDGERYLIVSCKGDKTLIGECGPDTTFEFDGKDTLKIKGDTISDFSEYGAPWASVQANITNLDYADVTTIGACAFYSFSNLKQIKISDKVTSIGYCAFADCSQLSSLVIDEAGGDLSIGPYAFYKCVNLKNIGGTKGTDGLPAAGIPMRVKRIGQAAFRSSGLVYNGDDTAGHIYYAGNRTDWKDIKDNGSPDIRDGKLLIGPTLDDEDIYAVVHYKDPLFSVLSFASGTGASGKLPEVTADKIKVVKKIIKDPIIAGSKVAEDTTFELPPAASDPPAKGDLKRDGFTFDGWKCSVDGKTYAVGAQFTMPAEDVTFTAQWKRNEPEQGDSIQEIIAFLEDEKHRGATSYYWTVDQEKASSKVELVPVLDKFPDGMVDKRIKEALAEYKKSYKVSYRIRVNSFREAHMGIANMTNGSNGAFEAEIYLTFKDGDKIVKETAYIIDGVIRATPYEEGTSNKTYDVTYEMGDYPDAPEPPKQDSLLPGQSFKLPKLDRPGFKFTGWKCAAAGSSVNEFIYPPNDTFTMRAVNVTFTAQWKEKAQSGGGAGGNTPGGNTGGNTPSGTNTASVNKVKDAPKLDVDEKSLKTFSDSWKEAGKPWPVSMTVEPVAEEDSRSVERLRTASVSNEMIFVKMTLVDGQSDIISDTGTPLDIIIPIDEKNATNVNVYREHEQDNESVIHDLSSREGRDPDDKDSFEVKNGSVIIHASKFSVYAIAYDRKSSGTSSTPGTSTSTGGSTSSGGSTGSSSGGGRSKPNIARKDKDTTTPPTTPSTTPADTPTAKKQFNDVPPTAWYYEAATWAYDAKIAKGEGGKRLNPNKLCTRAEMVTFLWRALGCPEPSGTGKTFVDVASGSWYAKAVQWAAGQKIVKGEGGKRFNPDATISRAEAVTFLYRTLGVPTALGSRFTDVPESAYYAEAVAWAAEKDIAQGLGKRSFSPAGPCTRAQVLTFLYRSKS